MRRWLAIVMLGLGATLAAPAWAHAHLVNSDPPVGSTVKAVDHIRILFTEPIEIAFSHVEVTGANGKVVPADAPALDPANHAVLLLRLRSRLAAGSYTVHWRVVSVDTHHTEGTFPFTVKR
jgi:copper resistance protein C